MVLSHFWYLNSVLVEISRKPQHYLQPTIQNEMLTCQNFSIFNENRKSAEMDFFLKKKDGQELPYYPFILEKLNLCLGGSPKIR